jgi:hypothetical protein
MAQAQDSDSKVPSPLNDALEKSLARLPTAPNLDYNPFVRLGQNSGQDQGSPQPSQSKKT